MTIHISIEELTAIKAAQQPNRTAAIIYFTATLPYYHDKEKEEAQFTTVLINKLKIMSDKQYNGLDLSKAIDTTEPIETDM